MQKALSFFLYEKENDIMFYNKRLTESFEKVSSAMQDISATMVLLADRLQETQEIQQKILEELAGLDNRVTELERKVGWLWELPKKSWLMA